MSRAVTTTAGLMAAPDATEVGCVVKTSWFATPGVMLNAALVTPVTPVAAAVSV